MRLSCRHLSTGERILPAILSRRACDDRGASDHSAVLRSRLVVSLLRSVAGGVLAASLGACASNATQSCLSLAGKGWSPAPPPANADALLSLDGVPDRRNLIWLSDGADQLMACQYGGPLVSPGCPTSRAYAFKREQGRWRSNGILLNTCDD